MMIRFCCNPNNYENVSYNKSEFDKDKTKGKGYNNSQSVKSSESSNNLNIIRLNNADRLVIDHLNINSLRNKFEMLREIVTG